MGATDAEDLRGSRGGDGIVRRSHDNIVARTQGSREGLESYASGVILQGTGECIDLGKSLVRSRRRWDGMSGHDLRRARIAE